MRRKAMLALLCIVGIVGLAVVIPLIAAGDGHNGPHYELEGTWVGDDTDSDVVFSITFAPASPANKYVGLAADVLFDPRVDIPPLGWAFPDVSPSQNVAVRGTCVRTGPRTFDYSWIFYALDENQRVVCIWVTYDGKAELIDADTYHDSNTVLIFSAREQVSPVFGPLPDQDADGDGLPDPGQEPVLAFADAHVVRRLVP